MKTNYSFPGALDISTRNLLSTIEAVQDFIDSKSGGYETELLLRIRLRDNFEQYFDVILRTEEESGEVAGSRAREVVEIAMSECLEAKDYHQTAANICEDLEVYSMLLSQSYVYDAVSI